MNRGKLILLLVTVVSAVALSAVVYYLATKRSQTVEAKSEPSAIKTIADADAWNRAVERIKEDRPATSSSGIEIPPELKHYDERHWFLATQVAEIARFRVQNCQDYLDLAAMIERHELVSVPFVSDTYVLFGTGAKATDNVFTRFQDDKDIDVYSESQLKESYQRLDQKRIDLQAKINSLKSQLGKLTRHEGAKQRELQKEIAWNERELSSNDQAKASLDQIYGIPEVRNKLFSDYQALATLAANFGGRSYDLNNSLDRRVLKINMLSSLRPEALKILEEVAALYHQQFNRPLPISSLVRPEQYQHALSRVNRNAVLIETPPHSTGLAFDIDYRYMNADEQTFLMGQLARIKKEGRIEVIRERNANYHVFAFISGSRPSDDLIAASLEKAGATPEELNPPTKEAAPVKKKPEIAKSKKTPSRNRRR